MSVDWKNVKRVLVVRLRSIGDTVLATPSLIALKRFLPDAQIDILLEDWVAPLLEGFDAVDNVIAVGKTPADRLKTAWKIHRDRYDVVFNLHGGTTATFFTRASGAQHRVGYADYQYSFLYNHLLSSSSDFWGKEFTHSAEQQLALLGLVGIPVEDKPKSRLAVTPAALESIEVRLTAETQRRGEVELFSVDSVSSVVHSYREQTSTEGTELETPSPFALLHPATAFATKQWAAENFGRVAEYLDERGLRVVAVAAKDETAVLENLSDASKVPIISFDDLTLPELTALASRAKVFIGNDSGIAHIAAAVNTPSVVIFGSSNRNHWRPWTDAPNEIVYESLPCQPCPGYVCEVFGEPKCILSVRPETVFEAIDRVLKKKAEPSAPPD